LGEVAEFKWAFFHTFWKEGIRNGPKTDPSTLEIPEEADGKAGGNFGSADPVLAQNGGEHLRVGGFGQAEANLFFLKIEAGVDGGGAAGPVDFEGTKESEGFTAGRAEPSKVVGDEKTGRVGEVGNAIGVAEKKTGGTRHDQEDFRSAPARKPARRKPSRTRGSRRSRPKR